MSRFQRPGGDRGAFGGAHVDNVAGHVHPRIIEQARQTGKLNISNRGLVTIPDDVWNMYNFDENESTTVDFSQKSSNSNWWNAVDLISINASDNEIESLDERLGTFVTVKHIDFRNNKIPSLPVSINKLENLTYLTLSNNKLQHLPVEFYSLPLIELYLDNNELESLDDAHLAKLKDLNVLSIAHNKLKALPASIGRLYKLKQLLINNNKLSSPLPYTLANANQLRVINANVNQLTAAFDVSNGEPLCFPVLQKLELHRNRLSSLTTPAAAAPLEFPELQELDLSQNRLYHLDDLLTTTPKLLALDISQNIFSEWPAGIFSLSNLHRLSIANNEFTSLALHLCLLEGLRAFSFEGNPIRVLPRVTGAQAILERLRNRLPEREEKLVPVAKPRVPEPITAHAAEPQVASPVPPSTSNEVDELANNAARVTVTDNQPIESVVDIAPSALDKVESTPAPTTASITTVATAAIKIPTGPPNVKVDISDADKVSHSLKLSRRNLSDDDPSNLPVLPPLPFEPVYLALDYNRYSKFPMLAIQFASTLTTLKLSHNHLTKFPCDTSLPPMYTLRHLDLSNNQITQFPDPDVAARLFPLVTLINLSENRLKGKTPSRLLTPRLDKLLLAGNQLTELDVAGCHGLHTLDLSDNDLQKLPFELGRCESIKQLLVHGNAFRIPRRDILQRGTDIIMEWLRDRLPE